MNNIPMRTSHRDILDVAIEAGKITLEYFQTAFEMELKEMIRC